MAIIFTLLTFFSTLIGGLLGLKYKDKLHLILGFTSGVLLAVVAFDILPEIFNLIVETHIQIIFPMIALVAGFLVFHIVEESILIHHADEDLYHPHKHPLVGVASALALSGHSFMDGVGIGLGFQINPAIGVLVAIAVISHDFTDGLNTVSLVLINGNKNKKAFYLLILDSIAPILGVLSTLFFRIPNSVLVIYLGFFAGFLLYIGASEILPEAHRERPSYVTILMTLIGVAFIFIVTRIV